MSGGTGAGSGEQTLRLEGFAEGLKGHRLFCISGNPKEAEKLVKGRLAAVDAEVAHRGRRVLVFQSATGSHLPPKWLVGLTAWDSVFVVRDMQDLKLVITHLQYVARPTRVVWAGMEPAAGVMAALSRLEGVTLIGVGGAAPASGDWHALFWGPAATFEEVEPAVAIRSGGGAGANNLRSVLKELRASDVGLVWSNIGETDKRGALYWYDPGEGVDAAPLDMREAAETLRAVAELLANGRG